MQGAVTDRLHHQVEPPGAACGTTASSVSTVSSGRSGSTVSSDSTVGSGSTVGSDRSGSTVSTVSSVRSDSTVSSVSSVSSRVPPLLPADWNPQQENRFLSDKYDK